MPDQILVEAIYFDIIDVMHVENLVSFLILVHEHLNNVPGGCPSHCDPVFDVWQWNQAHGSRMQSGNLCNMSPEGRPDRLFHSPRLLSFRAVSGAWAWGMRYGLVSSLVRLDNINIYLGALVRMDNIHIYLGMPKVQCILGKWQFIMSSC